MVQHRFTKQGPKRRRRVRRETGRVSRYGLVVPKACLGSYRYRPVHVPTIDQDWG